MRGVKWAVAAAGIVACVAGLSGCSQGRVSKGEPDPALRGQWVLVSGSDTFGAINLLGQHITLAITGSPTSTGRDTCSDYTATIYGTQRDLWVDTTVAPGYNCATSEQSVLQLEYLLDLQRVRQSDVTPSALHLSAQGVDLRFDRASALPIGNLMNRTWQLATSAAITLHSPLTFVRETGGSIQFASPNVIEARTTCESISATFRQVGDELVSDDVRHFVSLPCDDVGRVAAAQLTRVLENGFTFALTRNSLALESTRAGLALGFNEVEPP